jgi:hypothetical protein
MKTLTTLFALATLCATACGQTIKSLGYDTASGEVVYTGTNAMIFTNGFSLVDGETRVIDFSTDALSEFFYGIAVGSPIEFFGTNAATAVSTTRTNLGLYNTNEASSFAALALWDEANEQVAFRVVDDELRVPAYLAVTNAPTNTTNAARWIQIVAGENLYFIPLFQ